MAKKAQSKRGRPAGSKNAKLAHAEGKATRCPQCGSTRRAPYTSRVEQAYEGIDPDGQPYTHIVRRRTRCLACGQHRIDRHYECR